MTAKLEGGTQNLPRGAIAIDKQHNSHTTLMGKKGFNLDPSNIETGETNKKKDVPPGGRIHARLVPTARWR